MLLGGESFQNQVSAHFSFPTWTVRRLCLIKPKSTLPVYSIGFFILPIQNRMTFGCSLGA